MNTELRLKAKEFARKCHDNIGQRRKYSDQPYWVHTDEVGQTLWDAEERDLVVIAGYGHDLAEDVFSDNKVIDMELLCTWADIDDHFLPGVDSLINEVTNQFTPENYPYLNRKLRKQCEHARLAFCSPEAHSIKYADILSNLSDWESIPDRNYLKKYVDEKEEIIDKCRKGNKVLYKRCQELISNIQKTVYNQTHTGRHFI